MKLSLHEHISQLLFDHECVIVPGFGAFLTRYYAAEVNHATHMMRPPSRRVHFNASINENEGLLAKAISHTEGVSYTNALEIIKAEVAAWKHSLSKSKKLNLPGIGRLYIDEASKKLQFSPSLETNYSTSSYGLSIFRSPAIQREAQIRKTIHKAIEKHVVVEHSETKTRKVATWIPWAAALGPIIIASVIGYSYFTQGTMNPMENVAGINWMQFSRPIEKMENAPSETIVKEEVTTPVITKTIEAPVEIAEPEEVVLEKGYFIIVGSFKDAENAETYITELNSKGYDAYLANGDKRFFRVAVGQYPTHESAAQALTSVKQNLQPQSWIYSN
ncbi:SPOR domain-containing protein [Owenweeksia hongkongensis]|uniref:HU domain-containing protein n=1 Tax=Owenweeksia hongkongensis TaxID=253245 RepID=UPI003A913C21